MSGGRLQIRRIAFVAGTLVGVALAVIFALPTAPATAEFKSPLSLENLRLIGSPGWRQQNSFELHWDDGPGAAKGNKTVTWRIENETGQELASGSEPVKPFNLLTLTIPPQGGAPLPGRYRAVLQLADIVNRGAPAEIALQFDPAPPPAPTAEGPAGWIPNRDPIAFRFGTAGALPASGIDGYVISLDSDPDGSPCAGPCDRSDIDFSGPGSFSPGLLADGTSWFHAVAISGSGLVSEATDVPIRVDSTPPLVRLDDLPGDWINHPVTVTAAASDPLSGMGGPRAYTAIALDGSAPVLAPGGGARLTLGGEGVHLLSAFGRDAAGNAGASPFSEAEGTVRIDETPPRASFAATQGPAEPERLEVAVSDGRSGPSRDRGTIGVRPAGSGRPFEPLPTDVGRAGLSALWPSDDYPPGSYEFRAVAYDEAGNPAETTRRSDDREMSCAIR